MSMGTVRIWTQTQKKRNFRQFLGTELKFFSEIQDFSGITTDQWNIRSLLSLKGVNAEIYFQKSQKSHFKDMFLKKTFFFFWRWSQVYPNLYTKYITRIKYRHHCVFEAFEGFQDKARIFRIDLRISPDFESFVKGLKDFFGFWGELSGSSGWTK